MNLLHYLSELSFSPVTFNSPAPFNLKTLFQTRHFTLLLIYLQQAKIFDLIPDIPTNVLNLEHVTLCHNCDLLVFVNYV